MAGTQAAEAWRKLADRIHEAADLVEGPLGATNDRELAEAYRHLASVLSFGLETIVQHGSADDPIFTRWMSPNRKIYGDSPRTIYDSALVSPVHTYVVRGSLGDVPYVGFTLYGRAENGDRRIIANLDDVEVGADEGGAFELWLGPDAPDGAMAMELPADANEFMIRQYFHDPEEAVEAVYTIEVMGEEAAAAAALPVADADIARKLEEVGQLLVDAPRIELTLSALMASATPTELRKPSGYVDGSGDAMGGHIDASVITKMMPSPAIQYTGSWFDDLADDEMVVVRGSAPPCRMWTVQLFSRFMESLDFAHHTVYLTNETIDFDEDGAFEIVVAKRDNGAANFLTTTGLTAVNVAFRAIRAEGQWDVAFERRAWQAAKR